VYQSSRPNNVLARHNAFLGKDNPLPIVMMERDGAGRAMRLLRGGQALSLTVTLDLQTGGPYESFNVIGEIRGATKPDEIVVVGAHLDSWDLGDGALDNGANVAMLIDIARQIRRLGLRPARTIRFVLWNGEEQILVGSWRYTQAHQAELERHVMASSYDIGTGRITGFFTGGRPEIAAATTEALDPIAGLGPFTQIDAPIVGTDNFDFMLEGVANLVANQESANYGPNYHARSDTYDKVDLHQLRLNAAIAATVTWWYANAPVTWRRQSRAEIERLVTETDLDDQMKSFNVWGDWEAGRRGRKP
jgi:Zn-dependent M28 family amino/carboxypeptidase